MSEFDFFELNTMIIGCIAICIFILILYKKIEFRIYIPGFICIVMVFVVEFFDDGIYDIYFDFLESSCLIGGAALLLIAALLEYYRSNPKKNNLKRKKTN